MQDFGLVLILTLVVVGYIDCTGPHGKFGCEEFKRYPHPLQCSQYFQCLWGELHLRECQGDLEFSLESRQCVASFEANCQRSKSEETSTTERWSSFWPTDTTTTDRCVDYEKYPHETKCDMYYFCLGGTLYEGTCPNPLHFNTRIKECDLPENANCQIFTTTTGFPCVDFTFYPHAYDCRKYYQCLEGELFLLECPKEFVFNPIRESCDYPHMVDCPTTPAKCENYKKYPHEVECNKYYYCITENLFLMSCHEELHFNAIIEECDLPESAMCEIETRN